MLLGVGEPIRATDLARLVDFERELARHLLSTDREAVDVRTAPRLALPVHLTRQWVLAFAASPLTPSISANRSSTLMPLTTLGLVVSVLVSQVSLYWVVVAFGSGLVERGERRLYALALLFVDQAGEHLAEVRVLGAGMDVLPSVGLQKRGLDRARLGLADRPATFGCEVAGVGLGLSLQDTVQRGDQLDQLIDGPVALLRTQLGVVAQPLQLVEDGVLAFSLQ